MGCMFSSIEEAYQFYVNYGSKVGFIVRKKYHKKKTNGVISRAVFCCSKEGFRQVDKRREFVSCEASLACLLGKNGQYKVIHDLGKNAMKRTLIVNRSLAHAQQVHHADSSRTMELMSKEVCGGREHLGFLNGDYRNYIPKEKKTRIERGEAGTYTVFPEKKGQFFFFLCSAL